MQCFHIKYKYIILKVAHTEEIPFQCNHCDNYSTYLTPKNILDRSHHVIALNYNGNPYCVEAIQCKQCSVFT